MIVVIGAGLSGLSAAKTLVKEGGQEVLVIEASKHPGGRVWTIDHRGFRLDLGFQVALDSYPAFRSILPLHSLDPCYFGAGALIEEAPGQLRCLANPLQHPDHVGDALASRVPWGDRLRITKLTVSAMMADDDKLLAETGERSRLFLLESGFSDTAIESFFEPFFGGVFLDPDLDTDSSLLRYYLKMFATGRAFLPRGGMGRMGERLAESLPPKTIRYDRSVNRLDTRDDGVTVHLDKGKPVKADSVIVATDPATTCTLFGWPVPPWRNTRVVYMQSDRRIYDGKWLVLPSRKPRFTQHFAQLTNVDPSLAPQGRHLLSATVLDDEHLSERELYTAVKTEVCRLFPETGPALTPLHQIAVPRALPAQPPGFRTTYRRLAGTLPPAIRIAGDLTSNASLQNALQSGKDAAEAVMQRTAHR